MDVREKILKPVSMEKLTSFNCGHKFNYSAHIDDTCKKTGQIRYPH